MRLLERWVGENGRNNVLLHLATRFRSSGQSWEHRYWDDTFQLVAAPDGYFVTLFTKKQDPSEKVLSDFMSGRFERVEPIRSQPRPTLLFRSVLSYGAEQAFGSLAEDASFPVIYPREPADTAGGPDERRPRNIAPFLSNGRALWIGYSFTEEKAHRFALHNASQCDRRIVTYCQPTLSQHHRCNRPNVQVVSLPKLLELADDAQSGNRGLVERAVPGRSPLCSGQDAAPLVVADGVDRDAPTRCDFADLHESSAILPGFLLTLEHTQGFTV